MGRPVGKELRKDWPCSATCLDSINLLHKYSAFIRKIYIQIEIPQHIHTIVLIYINHLKEYTFNSSLNTILGLNSVEIVFMHVV